MSKIIVFPNKDKDGWQENWKKPNKRDLLNFPFPSRIIISANPGAGKTNLIKNIIVKAKPIYKHIFLCHYDPDTKEYDDLECITLKDIPSAKSKFFNPKKKSILIIDDHEFEYMTKDQKKNLDRIWGYTSTHLGLTVVCATQNFFNLPPFLRRMSDVFAVWKGSSDIDCLYTIGRKLGMSKPEFKAIMDHCKDKFDFIIFDLTPGTPCKIRLNGYTPIAQTGEESRKE